MKNQEIPKIMIPFNKNQIEVLRKFVDLSQYNIEIINNRILSAESKESFTELLNKISDRLIDYGLERNDEPNEYGIQLEEIIDIISRYVF